MRVVVRPTGLASASDRGRVARLDGRRPGEVRRVRCRLGVLARADGSAMYEQGNTRVMAAVYGPREVTNRMEALPDRALIKAELSSASFSASERKGKLRHDRRANELALLVQEAFEAAVLVQLFPNSQIDIFLQILQVDGGRTAAAINAATLALIDAGVPMRDFVVCCHAGFVENTPIVDLNYAEECSNCADMPVAILPNCGDAESTAADGSAPMDDGEDDGEGASAAGASVGGGSAGGASAAGGGDSIVMMQLDRRLPLEHFASLVAVAADGARQIHALLKEEVRQHTLALQDSRGSVAL